MLLYVRKDNIDSTNKDFNDLEVFGERFFNSFELLGFQQVTCIQELKKVCKQV